MPPACPPAVPRPVAENKGDTEGAGSTEGNTDAPRGCRGHWREEGSEGAWPQPDSHGLESVTLQGTMAMEPCRGEAAPGLGLGRDASKKSSCTDDLPVPKWARGTGHTAAES